MNYRPELKRIKVSLQKLLLDPNNPRFLDDHATLVDEEEFADSGVQTETAARMRKDTFRLDDLKKSIVTNGWQPVDMIFVRRLESLPGQYVVLEGNRRLMALRDLKPNLTDELAKAVDPLDVLEVIGTNNLEESRAQISYLLGVRHHGSLKTWGPFAQAHNIYERYLQLGEMSDATFKWDEDIARKISDQLGLEVPKIVERLRTYVAMKQLHEVPQIKTVGMEGRYYSLIREALPPWQSKSALKQYVVQDRSTFLLDQGSIDRLDAVCHFSERGRSGAPISSPDEWRPLARILGDVDAVRRAEMLKEVEVDKKAPSDVSAKRQAELRQPRWDRWLVEVTDLLRRLQIGNLDADDERAKDVAVRLARVLDSISDTAPGRSPTTANES